MKRLPFWNVLVSELGRDVPENSPLGVAARAWEASLAGATMGASDVEDVSERHARCLASLCDCLSVPDTARPEWAEQTRVDIHGANWFWWMPLINVSEKQVHWLPDQTLAGGAAAYLELRIAATEIEALLLHALLYQTAVERMAQLKDMDSSWRRRWGNLGPGTASQYRWWELDQPAIDRKLGVSRARSALVPVAVGLAGGMLMLPFGLGPAAVAGAGLFYLATLARAPAAGGHMRPRPSLGEELAHVANSAAWQWRKEGQEWRLARAAWTASAEAIRARMLATEAFGADWPGVAYRLADRLIAQERFDAENPDVGPDVRYAAL